MRWIGHVKRRDQEYVGRKTHKKVPPRREEEEADRSRDGWTVSTETCELSGQQKMESMTALAGRELCLPQRPQRLEEEKPTGVPKATAILYLFLSATPIFRKLDIARQHVLMPHDPDTPWQRHFKRISFATV